MTSLVETTRVLDGALAASAFSAVTAEVGSQSGVLWRYAGGRLAFDSAAAVTEHTVFDLASLTKVLSTTTLALGLVERRRLDLSAPVESLLPSWASPDRRAVTVRDLLEHSSGLPAYRPYYGTIAGRDAYQAAICREPLDYPPGTQAIYSDLGFILIGFILEDLAGDSLDRQFAAWRSTAGLVSPIDYRPDPGAWSTIAATENDAWRGRRLQGEVHDENAAALDGVAGHAGLFGTVSAVGEAARWWLARLAGVDDARTGVSASAARAFATPSDVPGSSRAVGWDTMRPTSSCGSRWSAAAIGHTGFTGTSLWLDPARDRYAVLLTNRVHPSRTNDRIQQVRRDFHDAVAADTDVS